MGDNPQTRTIGPYRIEGRLGAGGMGEVYRAYDERLDRQVAVKLIRRDAADDERARERFRREARTAASLSHPAVVQIHDLVATDDGDALVMEYVAGTSLAGLLAAGPLPLDRLLELGREIAGGLAAAHARGIVHRDLKAENVMVAESGHAKILDFGVAKRLVRPEDEASLSVAGAVVGTYSSMSPEQARGLAVDHRSDLFSFGTLLYEMATGRSPFLALTLLDTLSSLCLARQRPARELRPDLPEPLSELVDGLLEKDPARRPESAALVAAELGRIAAGTAGVRPASAATLVRLPTTPWPGLPPPASDEPPTVAAGGPPILAAPAAPAAPESGGPRLPALPGERSRPRERRRRWLAAAGLALAVAAAAAGGAFLWRRAAPPLTVAVPKPAIGGAGGPETELLAAGLRVSLLQALLGLDGVSPLPPEQVDPVAGPPRALARSVAADEIVAARLDCTAANCQVGLSRIAGRDGRLLWTESFEVPPGDPYLLAEAVAAHLRRGYAGRRARPGAAPLAVRAEDYREYLVLRRALEGHERPPGELLARLAAIEERSPRFVEAPVLAAEVRRVRFVDRRDPADLAAAFAALARARRIAPADPRPLTTLFEVAMIGEQVDRAAAALAELERQQPGDPSTLVLAARLAERRGDPRGALDGMRRAVARRPSWTYLARLADMEYRLGESDAARRDLRELLRRSPGQYTGETLLAQIELLSGNPATAAALYSGLVARAPHSGELVNLGLCYLLLRRYPEARERFRQAVAQEAMNPLYALNLADATLLSGDRTGAAALYRRVLDLVARDPGAAGWQMQSARAQALAHLGERRAAVEAAQGVLLAAHDNAQAREEVSLVYALVGEPSSALANADQALAHGVERVWFDLPWFDALRASPDFQEVLRRHATRSPRP